MFGNNVGFIGRLTADPEIQTFGENRVCNFTLARNRPPKKDGEAVCDFINFVAWNNQADKLVNFFKKGHRVGVQGRIQSNSFEDKTGVKRTSTNVMVESIEFIESKDFNGSSTDKAASKAAPQTKQVDDKFAELEDIEDDGGLPF